MTALGPVPFDAVKGYINSDAAELIEENKEKLLADVESEIPLDLGYYIDNLAKKNNWKPEKMDRFLDTLADINLCASFQVILKEIAVELDKKYPDHINKSGEIYCVSALNGRIVKADTRFIRNFRNFAAFRTKEDAQLACKITRKLLKEMFKSGKQKDKKCN